MARRGTCAVPGCGKSFQTNSDFRVNCDDHRGWNKGKPPERTTRKPREPHVCKVCEESLEGEHHSKRYCDDHNPNDMELAERVELAREFPDKVHLIYR